MNELLELRKLFNRSKIRQLEILGHPIHPDTPPTRFQIMYKALVEGEVQTDEQAAALIGLQPKDRAFRRFKLEFRRRIYTTLLFLDTDNAEVFNATQKASFYCWRRTALMETLWQRRCYENARLVAEEMLEKAVRYDQVTVVMEISKLLKRFYSQYQPNRERYHFFLELNKKYTTFWLAENKARMCYEQMVMPFVKSKSSQLNVADLGESFLKELRPLAEVCDTQIFLVAYYSVEIMVEMIKFNWDKGLVLCNESERKLMSKGEISNRLLGVIRVNTCICLIMLREYEEAIRKLNAMLLLEPIGGSGWFKAQEMIAITGLKAEQYNISWNAITNMEKMPQFERASVKIKESWQILYAYHALIVHLGEYDLDEDVLRKLKNFRLGKFLNEVPARSKDKKGLNVTIIILQTLFLLSTKEYDKIDFRLDSLRKYQSRYFRDEVGYYRTNLFVKILTQLLPAKFRKEVFLKKTSTFHRHLVNTPPSYSQERYEIEVVPYERLFEWVVLMLD